ncbi:phosphatidate phosphatase LPIN3 isoform X3 [Notamacropus eugenii]|uniref:phosphatidate phosphatase LPIN3 isoform X3 n=1 Tax=Notamacropus eugenii TaxID=9315 RepID=UPI003B67A56A
MNYVGQLAETVYVTVKELYEGLNPATLSGGIDVLVVKQPDGSFLCSPFHVRFGKLGVLRSREKVVDIEINGEPVDLQMKLGDNGEAFFVQQLQTSEEEVPSRLCTSPIPSDNSNEILSDPLLDLIEDAQRQTSEIDITLRKRKRRRRKKVKKKNKTVTAMTSNSSSEELEGIQSETVLEVKPTSKVSSKFFSADDNDSAQPKDSHFHIDVVCQENDSSFCTADDAIVESKGSFIFSDVECPLEESLSSEYLTSFKSDSELEIRYPEQNSTRTESHIQWPWGRLPQVMKSENVKLLRVSQSSISTKPLLSSFHSLAESQTVLQGAEDISGSPCLLQPPASSQSSRPSNGTKFCCTSRKLPTAWDSLAQDNEENLAENAPEMCSSSGSITSAKELPVQEGFGPSEQRKESKETQRRSQHLGHSDIHLEDLPSLNSTNATPYFPQSEISLEVRRWIEPSSSETNFSSVIALEDNISHLSDNALEQGNDIKLSLCGGLADNQDISTEKFTKYAVSYKYLADNPGILDDPNLVVKIGKKRYLVVWTLDKSLNLNFHTWKKGADTCSTHLTRLWHYNWAVAAPMILSLQAFQKSLPKSTIDKLVKEKMPKKSGRWWFSWGQKDPITEEYEVAEVASTSKSNSLQQKSDALGHILPQLGKDWTQNGIIKLYHKIHLNGYKFLYCSARSIGMADLTRGYLRWVNEQGCALPKGPLLLTPSSLFSALHREVIEKKPEVFKIACLTDIHHLFLPHGDPFFAGFGNRASDVYAYLHVGIPKSRIFTVNPQGELTQELIKNHKTTYDRLGETVELIFPPIKVGPSVKLVNPEYSQFSFWRNPFLSLSRQDLTNLVD